MTEGRGEGRCATEDVTARMLRITKPMSPLDPVGDHVPKFALNTRLHEEIIRILMVLVIIDIQLHVLLSN